MQLALEILTGVCATLPDPDLEPGADDEGIEDEVFEDSAADANADDSAMDETCDDVMAVDDATLEPNDSHTPTAPSFLPKLLEPLMVLIQPTNLSFSVPSPHAPTTSVLSAIHIAAFECLSNAFLALAAAPGPAASDVHAGQRVWSTVWAALAGVGNPLEPAPGSARAVVWDIAVGVLWGVGTVWTGKIVGRLYYVLIVCKLTVLFFVVPHAGSRGSTGANADRAMRCANGRCGARQVHWCVVGTRAARRSCVA